MSKPQSMDKRTQIEVCWSLHKNGISAEQIWKQLAVDRATVYRWLEAIRKKGIRIFLKEYQDAKKVRHRRTINAVLKKRIYALREEHHQCCAQKLQYLLLTNYQQEVSISTIYRVLHERYKISRKWKPREIKGKLKRGTKAREFIQVDTVMLGELYAFTAVDTYTKEVCVTLSTDLTSKSGADALQLQLMYFQEMKMVQRDGGPEFKKEWEQVAKQHVKKVYTSRPYKKNDQAFIEKFHATLRKECVGHVYYRKKDLPRLREHIAKFLYYYHYKRPHMALNFLTPHQFISNTPMSHLP